MLGLFAELLFFVCALQFALSGCDRRNRTWLTFEFRLADVLAGWSCTVCQIGDWVTIEFSDMVRLSETDWFTDWSRFDVGAELVFGLTPRIHQCIAIL
jgi:hypothetical protein